MSARNTRKPPPSRAAGLPQAEKPLTTEAQALLRKVEAGGVPLYTSDSLARIARENGVAVSGSTTPNEIIEALREKASQPAPERANARRRRAKQKQSTEHASDAGA